MSPDRSAPSPERLDLTALIDEMGAEISCLLGPSVRLVTGSLSPDDSAIVKATHDEIADLLYHLALDAHDGMPAGGTLTIRTGSLREAPESAVMIIHEKPASPAVEGDDDSALVYKGRNLGLGASYEAVKRAGGHFHVSCRDHETVLAICFPRAQ